MDNPLVIAVMITGKHEERIRLAQAAIHAFQQQSYEDKQLLIINTGQTRLSDETNPQEGIFEVYAPQWSFDPLGKLRNRALDIIADRFSADAWVIQWDDDDWHHPNRIATQVAHARDTGFKHPVTLRHQVRCSLVTGVAFVHVAQEAAWGIHGTVLHPQTDLRYEEVGKHEDSRFLKRFGQVEVCDNVAYLYVRFVHGNNTFSEQHIMHRFAGKQDQWFLPEDASNYLSHVLNQHYGQVLA